MYDWAKTGVVVPSISPTRQKLWSYADLMALRIVSWLRHPKDMEHGVLPASPMRDVRDTLAYLDRQGIDLWRPDASQEDPLLLDRTGKLWVRTFDGTLTDHEGRSMLGLEAECLRLLAPYSETGLQGPDLLRPRPSLRIVPLKVAGEPHVAGSRITSRSLSALSQRGFAPPAIAAMYDLDQESVEEALDLERQLSIGTRSAA